MLDAALKASRLRDDAAAFHLWACNETDLRGLLSTSSPSLNSELSYMTRSQRAVLKQIEELASYYFSGAWRNAVVKPRTSLLIAGPSGVGKSHIVRHFVHQHGLKLLRLTYGDWLPAGSRGDRHTLDIVSDFVRENQRGVIFIDELDKISRGFQNEWTACILNELYGMLDRTCFDGAPSCPRRHQAAKRLKEGVFLVGAGTWQDMWERTRRTVRTVGFSVQEELPTRTQIGDSAVIPTELLNRFSPGLGMLEPMKAEDFAEALKADSIDSRARDLGLAVDLHAAEASFLQMRWVEHLALNVAIAEAERSPGKRSRLGV